MPSGLTGFPLPWLAPHGWFINWLVFTLFALAHYLWVRDRIGIRSSPVSTIERIAFVLVVSVFFSFLYSAIFLPLDPVSQVRAIPVVVGIALPSVYLVLVGLDRVRDGQEG